MLFDRRDLLGAAACAGLLTALPARAAPAGGDAAALAALDRIAAREIAADPESATHYGKDVGALAGLRSRLADRSLDGKAAEAARLRHALAELRSHPTT